MYLKQLKALGMKQRKFWARNWLLYVTLRQTVWPTQAIFTLIIIRLSHNDVIK